MKTILAVFGTRPEAIKMCPLVIELKKRKHDFKTLVCVTGQHKEMLDQVLDVFDVTPDINLGLMKPKQDLFDLTTAILENMKKVLLDTKPDIVLVHGDTTTAFTTAMAAFYLHIPVGHVEAGLRTYNLESPFPEEMNRQYIDAVSKYSFAPTEGAKKNLLAENKTGIIYVTGNTAIDALSTTIKQNYSHPVLEWAKDSKLVLLTAHRRENVGGSMRNMFSAIRQVAMEHPEIKIVYPVHKNPSVREIVSSYLEDLDNIKLIEPLDVIDFHNFMARSYLILTDSGGIQEEAPSLGIPVLVMRTTTERPEGVEAGTLKLIGTSKQSVYKEFTNLLSDTGEYARMSESHNPYGDGHASERIANILAAE